MLTHLKILVWDAYNFKKCQKWGSGMSQTCIQSPAETKLKVIEISNMALNDCYGVF